MQEFELMRLVWLRGFNEGELRLNYPSERAASGFRLRLYNAARTARKNPHLDAELSQAASSCQVLITKTRPDDPTDETHTVIIRPRNTDPILEATARQLGIASELEKPPETEAEASLRRIREQLGIPSDEND